jgi:hypothetical protein
MSPTTSLIRSNQAGRARAASAEGPEQWFTGDVYIDPIARGEEPLRIRVSAVHFPRAPALPGTPTPSTSPKASDMPRPAVSTSTRSVPATSSTPLLAKSTGTEPSPDHFMTHVSMTEIVPDQPDQGSAHVTDAEYRGRTSAERVRDQGYQALLDPRLPGNQP